MIPPWYIDEDDPAYSEEEFDRAIWLQQRDMMEPYPDEPPEETE